MENEIASIRKRDGRIVPFDGGKITNAIFKAAQAVGGSDKATADRLAGRVFEALGKRFRADEIPNVEQIQDVVEKVLIEEGHAKTAKAYILYRQQHRKIREMESTLVDVQNTIDEYLEQSDWRVKENSNEAYSFSGLLLHTAGKVIATYALTEIYTPEISEAHKKGYFHIHDLSHGFIGYCAGWSLEKLLERGFGGVANKVDAKPAKHMDVVVHQMVNYIGCLQMEFAGAQAFSSVDTLLAPFVKADNLTYKQVKQDMQKLVFSLNIPSRWGCFSEDTEILTEAGWRNGTELGEGDVIATFNTGTEEIEYLPVLRMTKDHYKGKMKRLKNRITDQLITPNHRVLRRIHNYKEGVSKSKYVFEEADSLKTGIPLIPLGGTYNGNKMDGDMVNLLSWVVSEGSLCEGERVAIHQSAEMNPQNCDEIRGTLGGLEIPFDEMPKMSGFTGKTNCLRFRLNRPASRALRNEFFPEYKKGIPESIRHLPTEQIRQFVETYMKADGWLPENKIYTKKQSDADIFQEIIAKAGWGSTCYKNKNGIYVVRVIRHHYTQVTSICEEDYDGIVWCPTTENNTVVVRRKGKVFISGNSQYPFSNLTFDWVVPEDMKNKKALVGGVRQEFTYADCQKEMDMINKAFLEIMGAGDANGRVFTFPIPTYNLTKDFDWDSENANLLFEVTAKYGLPYFQNYIGSALEPRSIRAMCCRLNMDTTQLMNRPGSMWGPGDSTGSIGVVTINVNRLAYEAKNREEYFRKLAHYMGLAKQSLETKRAIINKNLENGLMPYTKSYLGTFRNHFSTIGLCGMNEACKNQVGEGINGREGKQFAIETLNFMRNKCLEFQIETGSLYNLEATPAESASFRLAKLDKEMYPDIITSGKDVPYLTNSTQLGVGETDDVIEALEHQNDLQPLYTGGTIFHTFMGEKVSSGGACKRLVRKIAENTRLPYYSITPTFSVCPEHGYIAGEHFRCPVCTDGGKGKAEKEAVAVSHKAG
ncbi:MAG: ribonucleoside triphosphate reductase [Candidatus Diapherotrites archaeon]